MERGGSPRYSRELSDDLEEDINEWRVAHRVPAPELGEVATAEEIRAFFERDHVEHGDAEDV